MATVDLSQIRLIRYEHDPYARDSEEEDEGEDSDFEPELDEVLIKTVDIEIVSVQAGKRVGKVRFWLAERAEIVEQAGSFVALLDDHSGEASDFAATLFTHRGHIKERIVREGKGVWGRELNEDDTVAYLQEIRIDKDFRNQGIGSWALSQILTHSDAYLEGLSPQGAQFIYSLACSLHSEWPRPASYDDPDPYAAEKEAMTVRIVGFFRRLGYRRVGTTSYFCCARWPTHPSRAVPANEDADEVERAGPFSEVDPTVVRAMEIFSRQNLV
ncbi:hypothetical protein JCM3774_003338 [Rhodotorula dairenensis]